MINFPLFFNKPTSVLDGGSENASEAEVDLGGVLKSEAAVDEGEPEHCPVSRLLRANQDELDGETQFIRITSNSL